MEAALETISARRNGHPTEDEYAAWLGYSQPAAARKSTIYRRRCFVQTYPDLAQWFQAPLHERVGLDPESNRNAFASARARQYLYFLAIKGYIHLDWDWLLAVGWHVLGKGALKESMRAIFAPVFEQGRIIGYSRSTKNRLGTLLHYIYLRNPDRIASFGDAEIEESETAVAHFGDRYDAAVYFGSLDRYQSAVCTWRGSAFALRSVLYHMGRLERPPIRQHPRKGVLTVHPKMAALIGRYAEARLALHSRPGTVSKIENAAKHLGDWLQHRYPEIDSFCGLTRDILLEYGAALQKWPKPLSIETQISRLSSLSVMFNDATSWEWEGAPVRQLIGPRDLPKRLTRLPRFIPAPELERLMAAIQRLKCPYQRSALIIARWSGARRSEILNLEYDCLDSYPDGTPRLRIPVGKTKSERIIPLHPAAAAAIRNLQSVTPRIRGLVSDPGGRECQRLFVRLGRRFSTFYVFEKSLGIACRDAGLVNAQGKATITAHRFRHTVGTELAEGGARLHTIMKMLGHTSTEMTLVYAHISDVATRDDYQRILGPGARVAGHLADTLKLGEMTNASVRWVTKRYLKTELELGQCLRLPEEGPCECDLFLTCAKFITTPEYIPRLRVRREKERALEQEAIANNWTDEAGRHTCLRKRIEELLMQLGEPAEGLIVAASREAEAHSDRSPRGEHPSPAQSQSN
jgi:integrase